MTEDLSPVLSRLEALGEKVTPAAELKLARFRDLLAESNAKYSLVSAGDGGRVVARHFVECAGFLRWLPEASLAVLDFGTGGGLPGIVVAALRTEARVLLLESRARKQVFLRHAVRTLELPNAAVAGRIDEASRAHSPPFDRVLVRGVGPISDVVPEVSAHLAPGGLLVMSKGARAMDEIVAAERLGTLRSMEWLEQRIDSLTTKDVGLIGCPTLVFRRRIDSR